MQGATVFMEFHVLGPVGVRLDGVEAVLDGSKQRTVLAALLLADGRLVSDAQLTTALWGWNPPVTAAAQIYTHVSRLRKRLGDGAQILRRRPGYLLRTDGSRFDLAEFEALATRGGEALAAGRHEEAAAALREGLALWHGQALADVAEHLAEAELPRLEETRLTAVERLGEAELALGRHPHLLPALTGLVAEHPLREGLRAQLMTALHRSGRQADALAVYHDGRHRLAEELGVDPGAALTAAYQAVLRGGPRPRPASRRPAAVTPLPRPTPAMLPPDLLDFTGRCGQLAALREVLAGGASASQAVVTGMPGAGKTALAVHAAHACRAEFPDGQLYADLGGSTGEPVEPYTALGWFLNGLGVPAGSVPDTLEERVQLYRSHLARQRVLVVLDDALNDRQVRPLLPGGGPARTVVTSRAALATLENARLVPVGAFTQHEAADLLARVVGPRRIAADPLAAERILRACGLLPLAVRVAGARLAGRPQWAPALLARQLDDPCHRFDALSSGGLDVREVLRSGYDQLPPSTRAAFLRLARLGPGAFPAQRAGDVLGAGPREAERVLDRLVEARLLEACHQGRAYRFHELYLLLARELRAEEAGEPRRAPLEAAPAA
ncbi:BTAD domain-containing putative transcriptional regulator [Kitasatospora sp. NPDC018619]|uniref:AfsR/SARP family transcriptional regulator n=1 Tax=unclassified Kitasatospora TaxID=2633591 RepID=UPI00378A338E